MKSDADKAANDQTGGENAARTARAQGQGGGENLGQGRDGHHGHAHGKTAVNHIVDGVVAFAQYHGQVDANQAHGGAADGRLGPCRQRPLFEQVVHGPKQSGQKHGGPGGSQGQSEAGGQVHRVDVKLPVLKDNLVSLEQPADFGAGHRGNGDGNDVQGRPFAENDFNAEDHAGNGGVENGTDGRGSAASHQGNPLAVVEAEEPGDVGSDGSPAHYHRCLGAGRSAAADGQATGDQAGKARPQAEQSAVARYGIDHFRHAVAGSLFDHLVEKQ